MTRCQCLTSVGVDCTRDGTMSFGLGPGGIVGWPLGAPNLRRDVILLDGDVIPLCIPHMRDLQTAIDARAAVRRAWPISGAAGDELTHDLRSVALQLVDGLPLHYVEALMTTARVLAARPRLATAWGVTLIEHTAVEPTEVPR